MWSVRTNCIVVFLIVYILSHSACSTAMDPILRKQCDVWVKTFYKIPSKERPNRFVNYNMEDQYAIFICGNEVIHPPAMYTAELFAMNGKTAIDFLKAKLSQAKYDPTIRDIILVFREMHRQRNYNVSSDSDLMRLITERVELMKQKGWKEIVEKWVAEIQQGWKE